MEKGKARGPGFQNPTFQLAECGSKGDRVTSHWSFEEKSLLKYITCGRGRGSKMKLFIIHSLFALFIPKLFSEFLNNRDEEIWIGNAIFA